MRKLPTALALKKPDVCETVLPLFAGVRLLISDTMGSTRVFIVSTRSKWANKISTGGSLSALGLFDFDLVSSWLLSSSGFSIRSVTTLTILLYLFFFFFVATFMTGFFATGLGVLGLGSGSGVLGLTIASGCGSPWSGKGTGSGWSSPGMCDNLSLLMKLARLSDGGS